MEIKLLRFLIENEGASFRESRYLRMYGGFRKTPTPARSIISSFGFESILKMSRTILKFSRPFAVSVTDLTGFRNGSHLPESRSQTTKKLISPIDVPVVVVDHPVVVTSLSPQRLADPLTSPKSGKNRAGGYVLMVSRDHIRGDELAICEVSIQSTLRSKPGLNAFRRSAKHLRKPFIAIVGAGQTLILAL